MLELFKKNPIVIVSASSGGEGALFILKNYGIVPAYFCDNSTLKQGTEFFNIAVISPKQSFEKYGKNGANYVIASISYYAAIKNQLLTLGIDEKNIFYYQTLNIYFETGKLIQPFTASNEQLKKIQNTLLKILVDVHEICEKHNIKYYLFDGTLLGCVRHKGFIPWDDDVDIVMFRDDYENFFDIMQKDLHSEYEVTSPLSHSSHEIQYSLKLKNTVLEYARPYALNDHNKGIAIDFFILDNVKQRGSKLQFLQKRCSVVAFHAMLYKVGCPLFHSYEHKFLTKIVSKFSKKAIWHMTTKILTWYGNDTQYVYHFYPYSDYDEVIAKTWERTLFDNRVLMEFEGHMLWIPAQYDEVLTKTYGEYMVLPPESQRFTNHDMYLLKFGDEES